MSHGAAVEVVDLDETGWLLDPDTGQPVSDHRLRDHLADRLAPPSWATDILVYVHGWQTSPGSAHRTAERLLALMNAALTAVPDHYPALAGAFSPWCIAVRWPSSSRLTPAGYRKIRDRAHTMGALGAGGHAAHILGRLLGYLDAGRADPGAAPVLANRDGQYLHLVGHSFGCRFLCEAVQWAADPHIDDTLGWSAAGLPSARPFTVDSLLLFQMAARRDAFISLFPRLLPNGAYDGAPLRGPIVTTYSRHDRATGFWHLQAEQQSGIGHAGIGPAPAPMFTTRMLALSERYPLSALDHTFVNVDASEVYVRGHRLNPAGAHSDHVRLESAHLLLTLADYSR
ncbi:hypothetical protein [Streptomyces fumanus]|uniref:Alpha/beta hydrolase n=1 Tax=Streptomyces fumanus TaxID=67302 RepID=A0A919E9L7_9ACTN|nr:hypothetical protein [Streptomyces fumanus]GHF27999.1 hypothetical protein GCM10018772_62080 [Streptomyces fumanus]